MPDRTMRNPGIPSRFKAFVVRSDGALVSYGVETVDRDLLPDAGVGIRVTWSGINYKDALTIKPDGGVARLSPLIPGTDLAGEIIESEDPARPVGMTVMAHGYALGTSHHGAFAEYARLPSEWTMPLPDAFVARDVMAIGTAGFTAARCVIALESYGIRPESGPILVTGATGGVGGYAVDILLDQGFEVWALTTKASARGALRHQGVQGFVERSELALAGSTLGHRRWAAAIDSVGESTLPYILRTLRAGGVVAATGNVSGSRLETTVFPFILRGVSLVGVDSADVDVKERTYIWERLASDMRQSLSRDRITEIPLDGLTDALPKVLGVRLGDATS